ncbi:unnamed protein product [Prorocentrum cordatum]|uniref:Uncharacterized protein n=1 Tax=Prorocentrum cordatum TaxID=2364126 RepID=A0ABN9UW20_9DINO|nr:unnamed protein product [Polarella glacialis]
MHVAVCVAGEARSLWQPEVHSGLLENLWRLELGGTLLDTYLALAEQDEAAAARHRAVLRALRPRAVSFDRRGDCEGSPLHFCGLWLKFRRCRDMIELAESELGVAYAWVLRVRPDARWLDKFPPPRGLSTSLVHARLRCPGLDRVRTKALSHHVIKGTPELLPGKCWPAPGRGALQLLSCACPLWGCPAEEQLVDDNAAWVPRRLLRRYFGVEGELTEGLRSFHPSGGPAHQPPPEGRRVVRASGSFTS